MRTLPTFLFTTILCLSQTPVGLPNAQPPRTQQPAPIPNLSQRPSGSSLGMIRVGAADNNIWFGWRVGIATAAFRGLTVSEALAKADRLAVTGVEASNEQTLSPEIPKKLDFRLQTGERAALVRRLRELNQQIFSYHIENLGADETSQRKVFEFVKAINVGMIVTRLE